MKTRTYTVKVYEGGGAVVSVANENGTPVRNYVVTPDEFGMKVSATGEYLRTFARVDTAEEGVTAVMEEEKNYG